MQMKTPSLGTLFLLVRICLLTLIAIFIAITVWDTQTFANQRHPQQWIGTWGASPQRNIKGRTQTFHNQTLRLIVHISAGGRTVRVKLSNIFGDQQLAIGSAHIARRTGGANIDSSSDRVLNFGKHSSTTIPAGSEITSDPVNLEVDPLSDLAVSLFLPELTPTTTLHILAQQTNYVSQETGDLTAAANFTVGKEISFWPFLAGVDILASSRGATIVAFGSSLTDGDGSTKDTNHRYPDVLAGRLQKNGDKELGVVNEGIIGNRLLNDNESPGQSGGPPPLGPVFEQLGQALGDAGVRRFDRDVLSQAGAKYVILALGVNDLLFPGSWTSASDNITAKAVISGNRQLIGRAHRHGLRAIGTTIPPFEHALFRNPPFDAFYSPEKEKMREDINAWIRNSGEFDGVIDFDAAVRDPNRPTQILPSYDSGDHLHVNDAGNVAQANVISLGLFHRR
jgi:lysophospholipase L1-like esterase